MSRVPSRYLSPLRYPGGKGRLAKYVAGLLGHQQPRPRRYVEPFAGGAGVGLRLLVDEYVDEIVINDLNPGIAAFWRAVFERPDELLSKLRRCKVTVAEWREQRQVYLSKPDDDVDLGFALFFLNRTNRSGILDGRPIGGYDQSGKWKIDARFDRGGLEARLDALSRYASRVTVTEMDGIDLIGEHLSDSESFIYADPPYLGKGDHLYLDTLGWEDHVRLARLLGRGGSWFLTYDADPRITEDLYADLRCAEFTMTHSAAVQHEGREYAVFAPSLTVPTLAGLGGGDSASFVGP
ncbi:MAG TPA: DNA adenine methylase [Solirubrobacterales bacterium]|nr:DNA adenine methylase [Solirubrobacterales bacterium]